MVFMTSLLGPEIHGFKKLALFPILKNILCVKNQQAIILIGICFLYLACLIDLSFYKEKKPWLVMLLKSMFFKPFS